MEPHGTRVEIFLACVFVSHKKRAAWDDFPFFLSNYYLPHGMIEHKELPFVTRWFLMFMDGVGRSVGWGWGGGHKTNQGCVWNGVYGVEGEFLFASRLNLDFTQNIRTWTSLA